LTAPKLQIKAVASHRNHRYRPKELHSQGANNTGCESSQAPIREGSRTAIPRCQVKNRFYESTQRLSKRVELAAATFYLEEGST